MKLERTKNATKNIVFGMVMKFSQMVMPFLMRTAMIYLMGVEYLGLNSLFASILQVLNMMELGVGSAMVFSMYRPVVEDDTPTICALMALYRRYYRIIGLIIGAVGLVLTPAVPRLISGEIPAELNIYVLYLLNLGATVLSYWLFAYKNCLFRAHQRMDVISKITVLTTMIQYVLQLLLLFWFRDYYLYVIVTLGSQALNNLLTAIAADKQYPAYKPAGKLPGDAVRKINRRVIDLFTCKFGTIILKSSDPIVISAFLGLAVLAVYQNYFFIVSSVIGVVEILLQSITAGLGNSFLTETKRKNYNDLKKFTFLFLWLTGVCVCCFLGMYQPFMEIWVGRELMLQYSVVVCFAVYFFVYTLYRLMNIYKDAAGLWHEDRFRPLITALVNLGLNLWWVQIWGIYGVLLSTVVSMVLVGMPWILHNVFTLFFDRSMLKAYVLQLLGHVALTTAAGCIVALICRRFRLAPWGSLAVCTAVSVLVPNLVFYLALGRTKQFEKAFRFLKGIFQNRLRLNRKRKE